MGRHSAPMETIPDGVDLSDEAVPLYEEVWDDFSDDGRLTDETVNRVKHWVISMVHGVVVAVALAVGPVLYHEIMGGNYDLPSLWENVSTVAVAAVVSHFRPKR